MLERERQVAKSLRKHICAFSIAASRAALKQGDGFLERQNIKRDFLRPAAPIRKAGCNENPGFCGWQKIGNLVWARNIVVDEQPRRALLGKPTQGSLRSLLHIGFLCRRSPQQDQEARKAAQKPHPRLSRAPTHAFIKAPEAIGVLDCKRRLSNTTQSLHGGKPDCLSHGGGVVLDEDGVEPLEFLHTTREDWDAWGYAEKRLTW